MANNCYFAITACKCRDILNFYSTKNLNIIDVQHSNFIEYMMLYCIEFLNLYDLMLSESIIYKQCCYKIHFKLSSLESEIISYEQHIKNLYSNIKLKDKIN